MGIINRFRIGAIACMAVGAVAFAGCGGGDDSSTTTAGTSGASGASGTALSQDEFVSQADAICKDADEQQSALTKPTSTSSLSDLATYVGKTLAITKEAYAKLGAITPPSDQQADYSQWLSHAKDQIAIASQLEAAAKAGDESKVSSLNQTLSSGAATGDSEAKALGFTECGNDSNSNG